MLLWAFYQEPGKNARFAYYIVHELPPGVRGVLIAGIFATAIGSLSTALNALATSFTEDWYPRYVTKGRLASRDRPRGPGEHDLSTLLILIRYRHRLRQNRSQRPDHSHRAGNHLDISTAPCSGCFWWDY